jgi:hypothetical protein
MLRALFVLGIAVALTLSLISARPTPPVVGPHAIIEMHEKLFAALDRGDGAAAAALVGDVDDAVSVLVLGADGSNRWANGSNEMKKLLSELALERKAKGGTFETKILRNKADCPAEQISWGMFELETKHTIGDKTGSTHYAMTSIARWTKDGMRLVHGHLSVLSDAKR